MLRYAVNSGLTAWKQWRRIDGKAQEHMKTWLHPRCSRENNSPVRQFQVLGERNSGTNFVSSLMQRNFGEKIEDARPYGWKHGFIDRRVVATPGLLTLVVYRHPLRWLQSVHAKPLELTKNFQTLRFEDFLETPWTGGFQRENGPMEPSTADLEPETGRVFPTPMAMRSAKIAYLEAMKGMGGQVCFLRFEDVNHRPKSSISAIADHFSLPLGGFEGVHGFKGGKGRYLPKLMPRPNDLEMAKIRAGLDQDLEASIGYDLEDVPDFDGLTPWEPRSIRARIKTFSLKPRWGGNDRRVRE